MYFLLKDRRFNVLLADIKISENGFRVMSVPAIYNENRLPLLLQNSPKYYLAKSLEYWLKKRLIPRDRPDLDKIARIMSSTPIEIPLNTKAQMELMGFLSMSRSMTDKYWLTPLTRDREKNPVTQVFLDLPVHNGLSNKEIIPKSKYLHMDFVKNGFALDFKHAVLSESCEIKDNVSYNTPDFCTNGSKTKYWDIIDKEYWLVKHEEMTEDKANILLESKKEFPDLMPKIEPIMDDNFITVGYRTKCLTDAFTSIITLEELCESADKNSICNRDTVEKVEDMYGVDLTNVKRCFSHYARDFGLPAKTIYTNSGILVDADSREIIKPVFWL